MGYTQPSDTGTQSHHPEDTERIPMAAEITKSLLGTNGGLVASVLSDLVLEQLYDGTDLSNLMMRIPWSPMGSGVLDVTQDAVPGAYTAATSELDGSNIANSAYTTSEFSLTPALYARRYTLTDLIPIAGGPIQIERVARKLVEGIGLTMTDLLCTLFGSLSNSVGTSTVDLTVSDIFDAQFQLNTSNVGGRYACVLYPEQFNNLQSSLRAEAGAVQFIAATPEMLAAKGPGFKGSWLNIDFYQSDSVGKVNTNADYAGAMFGAGCFGYTMADARLMAGHIPPGLLYLSNEAMVIEMARDQTNFMTALVASIFPAVVEIEDARGVEIISDV